MIDCVVAPFDQLFPVEDDELSTTSPPAQKVAMPLAVIVGVAGIGCTITFVVAEIPDVHPKAMTSTE